MLRIAQEEGVVTHLSNLYDTFFPGGRDHRIERPSVTQVPYFEGTVAFSPALCAAYLLMRPLLERSAECYLAARLNPCCSLSSDRGSQQGVGCII